MGHWIIREFIARLRTNYLIRNTDASTTQTSGIFEIYSAGVRQEALDRLGANDNVKNSVFTRAFIQTVQNNPGLTIQGVAVEVRKAVYNMALTVKHTQTPAYYDQLVGDTPSFHPAPPTRAVPAARQMAPAPAQ